MEQVPLHTERQHTLSYDEQLDALGYAYRDRYNARLEDFFADEEVRREQLAEVFWQDGVLDRLTPEASEERVARRITGRDVFDGSRDQVELYWRLLTVCEQVRSAGQGERSTWVTRPIEFTIVKLLNTNPDVFDSFFGVGEERIDIDDWFMSVIAEHARAILTEKAGVVPTIPTIGSEHVYRGIPAVVAGYTKDGLVVLAAQEKQDQVRLARLVSPASCAVGAELLF